ncbi:MAG: T9SS type A sorting domain-containing protein [Bacteroidales bacterium]|nr:T9SS type A sorting domain-containing protein [Bacteroidales bacterium]
MRKFLFLILFISFLSVSASDVLVVRQNDSDTSWTISTINEITFDGSGAKIIFTDGTLVYYAKENLKMIDFNISPSSINNIVVKNPFTIQNNIISADTNLKGIQVYSLNGTLVAQSSNNQLDISNLSAGSYIVKIGKQISKIIKK